jgi:subtilisin family serine protease
MKRRTLVLLALLAMVATLLPVGAGAAEGDYPEMSVPDDVAAAIADGKAAKVYIVQMADAPVAGYDGSIARYAATKPTAGEKLDPTDAAAKTYRRYLLRRHNRAIKKLDVDKFYDYTYAFNGFAAVMTPQQAEKLAKRPDVISVQEDFLRYPQTDNSPDFLGLTAPGSPWESDLLGEQVLVGVIDTGIWPEHPSFSDRIDLSDPSGAGGAPQAPWYRMPKLRHKGFWGKCESGERFSQDDCNGKLVVARYFKDGFTNNEIKISGDYLSPRDADGHGSHTASTAAGNAGVTATRWDNVLGTVSGMAPRARIAMYKACWADAGCATSDLTMAIDTAVHDGVDVINYSIGGGSTALNTSDAISFLFAEDAGVFIATSAGNSGPGASTLGNPAVVPWVTSVGASFTDRTWEATADTGDGATYTGGSLGGPGMEYPLVDAADAGEELCLTGSLDPAVVAGSIVLCKRGAIALVDKSQEVMNKGGVGMLLYNDPAGSTNQYALSHAVPTVHLVAADGLLIKAYIAGDPAGATASINPPAAIGRQPYVMAGFSSRGPNGGAMDIIKPDVIAPGEEVLAAASPTPFTGAPGQLFQSIGGTSMASPHVAGIYALLKEANPGWTPAIAKSALMTTADNAGVTKEDGATAADPFDMGSGHLNPNPAFDPGLAYDAGFYDYVAFLCGAEPSAVSTAFCDALISMGYPTDPSQLNLSSFGIAALAGLETLDRYVTNVGPAGTYDVSVDAPLGIDVTVSPSSLTLAEGETAKYQVTFTTLPSATIGAWTFGSLTWSDGTRDVYSPIAVRPFAFSAPDELAGDGSEAIEFEVDFGYTGTYAASAHGLVAADEIAGNVPDDPGNSFAPFGPGTTLHMVSVPAGAVYARFSLFDAYTDGADDLDLYVYYPWGGFAGGSGSPTSAEQVDVAFPPAGDYYVFVHGWQTDGADANYTLFNWSPTGDEGNMTITAPTTATLGGSGSVSVSFSGLTGGTMYLGAVGHGDGVASDPDALTLLNIVTP